MIQKLDIADQLQAQNVWELQQRAYRVEADLIGWDALPPLLETVEDLMECKETFEAYWEDGILAGAISYKQDGDTLDIHRMMVHPDHFRKGIAGKLLVHAQANAPGLKRLIVSTGAKNYPAIKLYERNGFALTGRREVAPGLTLAFLEKEMPAGDY